MAKLILIKEISDAIRKDPLLFGKVAEELGTTPSYTLQLLNTKNKKLTQAGVLRILREHLGKGEDTELLEEMQESELETAQA